jgi:hypothetical protein
MDSFNFSTDNKFFVGTLLVDLDDPLKEYIPAIVGMLKSLKDELGFQYIARDNGRPRREHHSNLNSLKISSILSDQNISTFISTVVKFQYFLI